MDARCYFCKAVIVDGREQSGFTGIGPDWMTPDGDFGCNDHPLTDDDGTAGHRTEAEVMEIIRLAEDDGPLGADSVMRENLYLPAQQLGQRTLDHEADRLLAVVCSDLLLIGRGRTEGKVHPLAVANLKRLADVMTRGGSPDPFPYLRHGADSAETQR